MKNPVGYALLAFFMIALFLMLACEENSNPAGTRSATIFTWEYVMDDPPYFHSIQEVPPLAVEEDGTVWIAGYLGTPGNSHRCMARHKPGDDWESWADESPPGDYYAYDVGVGYGGIFVTIVGNPTLEQSGLYQFIDNPPYFQGFQLVYAHPDPGPVAFNDGTGIMFTRRMNNANSGYLNINDLSFHICSFPNITGDVLCAAIWPNADVALAITSDGYVLRLFSSQLTASQFPQPCQLFSVDYDWDFTLCTEQGLYHSFSGDVWQKDDLFPGEKAFSSSVGGDQTILGEKDGVRKVYKYHGLNPYIEETLNYLVGTGRLVMNQHLTDEWHQGYIYDGEALVERVAH
jgi:hypothetical protein